MKKFLHPSNRSFLRLWLAQIISQFGDRIHQLALIGLVAQRAFGSTTDLTKLMTFTILPVLIVQPFAGALIDRFDKRKILFISDIARGLLVLSIPLFFLQFHSMVPIYLVVFLVFCFSRFYVPSKMAIIPDLVIKEDLFMANSLVSTTGMIAFTLGAAIGAFLIEYFGARNGFIIDAITFFLSATLLVRLKTRDHVVVREPTQSVSLSTYWNETKEGFVYIYEHDDIRFIIKVLAMLLAAAGSVYVVIIVFVQTAFGSVTKDLGILAICLGIGLFIGAMVYGKLAKKFIWYQTIFFCLIGCGLMLILFSIVLAATGSMALSCLLTVCWGVVMGPIFIASNTVIQIVSDERMRGKVFSAVEIVIHLAFLTAMLISSFLSNFIDEFWILIMVGSGVVILSIYFWRRAVQKDNLARL